MLTREQQDFEIDDISYHCIHLPGEYGIKLMHRCLNLIGNFGESLIPIIQDPDIKSLIDQTMKGTIILEEPILAKITSKQSILDMGGRSGTAEELLAILAPEIGEDPAEDVLKAHLEGNKAEKSDIDQFFELAPSITRFLSELMVRVDEEFLFNFLRDLIEQSVTSYRETGKDSTDFKTAHGTQFNEHFNATRLDVLLELAANLMIWNYRKPIEALKNKGLGGKLMATMLMSWETMEAETTG